MPRKLKEILLEDYYWGDYEHCGFIMRNGTVIETQNIAEDPTKNFEMDPEEVAEYCDKAASTWHTHPSANNNLSVRDMEMFLNWPELSHYIIGNNGVREYIVQDGVILIA